MAGLDTLPPDQRAVLQLVLQRGRSFDEIAQMLSIDRAAVRDRALAALDALGPQTRVPAERRALITDYLLGQLPPRVAEITRGQLASSPADRAWARVLAAELAPLAAAPLPEIPAAVEQGEAQAQLVEAQAELGAAEAELGEAAAELNAADADPEEADARAQAAGAPSEREARGGEQQPAEVAERYDERNGGQLAAEDEDGSERAPLAPVAAGAAVGGAARLAGAAQPPARAVRRDGAPAEAQAAPDAPDYGRPDRAGQRPSSRRGGAILLAAGALVAIAVIVVIVVLVSSGGGSRHAPRASRQASSATHSTQGASSSTGGAASSTGAQVVSKITLTSPLGKSTRGAAEVVKESGQLGLVLVGVGVPANSAHNAYAVWLSNGPNDSERLGFVNPGVKSNGQLRAAAALPSNASHYSKLLVTLETTDNPKAPGKIVLEGSLGLS